MSAFQSVALIVALISCPAATSTRSVEEIVRIQKASEGTLDSVTPQYVNGDVSPGKAVPVMDLGYSTHPNKQVLSPVKHSVRYIASPYKGFVIPKIDDPRPEEASLSVGKGGQEQKGIPFTKKLDLGLKKFDFRQLDIGGHKQPAKVAPNMLPDMADVRPQRDIGFTTHANKDVLKPVTVTTKHHLDVPSGFVHPVYDGALPTSTGPVPNDATENWMLDPRLTRPVMGQGPADA